MSKLSDLHIEQQESGESHSPIGLDRKDLPNYLAIKSREIAYEKKVSTNSILKPMLIEHGFEDKDGVALEPYSILVDYYEDLDKIPPKITMHNLGVLIPRRKS